MKDALTAIAGTTGTATQAVSHGADWQTLIVAIPTAAWMLIQIGERIYKWYGKKRNN